MKIVDCTFRDGGYYTLWEFADDVVNDYTHHIKKSGIDYVELGYRSLIDTEYFGKLRYTTDSFLNSLTVLSGVKIAVMLDAKEFVIDNKVQVSRIEELFLPAEKSKISLVRICTVYQTLDGALEIAKVVSRLGYETSINLMQVTLLKREEIKKACRKIEASGVKTLFLADSFGGLFPSDVEEICNLVKNASSLQIGVHFHNNIELAFANTLKAIDMGVDFVDGTILGIGRGAGNLRTENLLKFLKEKKGLKKYNPQPVFQLISDYFGELKEKYKWGSNTSYLLSGYADVHPTYVIKLLDKKRYNAFEISNILYNIRKNGAARSFDEQALSKAITHRLDTGQELEKVENLSQSTVKKLQKQVSGKEVLIVGRGPSVQSKQHDINSFISRFDPVVIECNLLPSIQKSKHHFCTFLLYKNLVDNAETLRESGKIPVAGFPKVESAVKDIFESSVLYHFAYDIKMNCFEVNQDSCIIPYDVVSMYAVALALMLDAKTISLAGFDGYDVHAGRKEREQQAEMERFFVLLRQCYPNLKIQSLTPTNYYITTKSIYYRLMKS